MSNKLGLFWQENCGKYVEDAIEMAKFVKLAAQCNVMPNDTCANQSYTNDPLRCFSGGGTPLVTYPSKWIYYNGTEVGNSTEGWYCIWDKLGCANQDLTKKELYILAGVLGVCVIAVVLSWCSILLKEYGNQRARPAAPFNPDDIQSYIALDTTSCPTASAA